MCSLAYQGGIGDNGPGQRGTSEGNALAYIDLNCLPSQGVWNQPRKMNQSVQGVMGSMIKLSSATFAEGEEATWPIGPPV